MEDKSEQQRATASSEKGRSCKGFLYYSSTLESKARNPRCIGIPRSLPQVPNHIVGKSEVEASKEGRTIAEFYYGCLGYSVYETEKDSSAMKQDAKTKLPVCVGFKMLASSKTASGNTSSVPAHVHKRDDAREFPPRQTHRPTPATAATGDGFLTRFTRNANLVASGVLKNAKRVGNYVKETVDDVLAPFRGRPK